MSARDWTAGSPRAITLRSMAALGLAAMLGCATVPVDATYEAKEEASLSCGQLPEGRSYETLAPCYSSLSAGLTRDPELILVFQQARLECARWGIEPMTPAMDQCMRDRATQLKSALGPSTGQIVGQVFLELLGAAGRAARAASQPDTTVYPEVPPLQPPIYCTTMPDGWGGSTTTCH